MSREELIKELDSFHHDYTGNEELLEGLFDKYAASQCAKMAEDLKTLAQMGQWFATNSDPSERHYALRLREIDAIAAKYTSHE